MTAFMSFSERRLRFLAVFEADRQGSPWPIVASGPKAPSYSNAARFIRIERTHERLPPTEAS